MKKPGENDIVNSTEAGILQAAEHEFMSRGFAGARTTSIAEAAGVTHAMLHYYFRTKEKLFERIIMDKMKILRDLLLKTFGDIHLPLDDMIRNLINLHLDFIAANPELPRFLICEVLPDADRLAVFAEQIQGVAPGVISRLQQKIDEEAAAGRCRSVDAGMLMLDILSLNIFPSLAAPMVSRVLGDDIDNTAEFSERRKQENFDTIMCKLRPIPYKNTI